MKSLPIKLNHHKGNPMRKKLLSSVCIVAMLALNTPVLAAPGGNGNGPPPSNSNAGGGNVGTGNNGNGVGNTGPGNQGSGPNPGAGNAGGGTPPGGGGGNPPPGGGGGGGNPPPNNPPPTQQSTGKSYKEPAAVKYFGFATACAATFLIAGAAIKNKKNGKELTYSEAYGLALGCYLPVIGWFIGNRLGKNIDPCKNHDAIQYSPGGNDMYDAAMRKRDYIAQNCK